MRRSITTFLLAALLCCACSNPQTGATNPAIIPTAGPSSDLIMVSRTLNDTPILEDQDNPTPVARRVSPTAIPARPARPTPEPVAFRPPVRIVIPTIDMDQALVAVGLDTAGLPIVPKHAAAWYSGSAAPDQGDNIVLWGHALRFKNEPGIPAPFGRLKDLAVGEKVVLFDTVGEQHSYVISEQVWATPDQVNYILPQGHEQLTLVSCIGDKVVGPAGVDMTHRLITIAKPDRQ